MRGPRRYAVGDAASVGTPKTGLFAERQAAVVAQRITGSGEQSEPDAEYDGRSTCYIKFGTDRVARVEVTFTSGQVPTGAFEVPTPELAADKAEFGASRV